MTLGEIIKGYRKEHHISQDEFAKRANLSKAYISILERNFNPSSGRPPRPTYETIATAAMVMGTDFDTLFRQLPGDTEIDLSTFGIQAIPATVARPRLGTIACGEPILAEQNFDGFDRVPDYVKCDFTLLCKGDSMVGARIYDGDIVCIKKQPTVDNGQIAAVSIDGDEATLKRFYLEGDTVTLLAENPAYPPKSFAGEAANRVRVLGLATHFISMIR